jgi:hypothetical protein
MSQAILSPSPSSPPASPLRRRARRRFPAILSLAVGLALATSAPVGAIAATTTPETTSEASSETAVSWSVRPADTAEGTGRPNFGYEANPGGTVADALAVTNRSTTPIDLTVYAADGFLTDDGSLDILPASETSTELGSWVVIDTPQLSLASGASTEVPFRVDVPADTPPGDYAAGIVASMLVTADNGTITERRLGSRIHLRVLGDLAPTLTVSDVSVSYHDVLSPVEAGTATVTYTLTNTGNTRLDPDVDVAATGPFGWAPVHAGDDAPELLPGSSMQRTIEMSGVAPLAFLSAEVTAAATVVSPGGTVDQSYTDPISAAGSAATAAVPWSALVVALVAAGIIVWILLSRKREKAAQRRAVEAAVAAAIADREALVGQDAATTPVAVGTTSASP